MKIRKADLEGDVGKASAQENEGNSEDDQIKPKYTTATIPFLSVRAENFLIWPGLWISLIIIVVEMVACVYRGTWKVRTVSVASNKQPMSGIYSLGVTIYGLTVLPGLSAVYTMFNIKITRNCTRFKTGLKILNKISMGIALLADLSFLVQALVSLDMSSVLHTTAGFLFLGLSAVYIAINYLLLLATRKTETEKKRFFWQFIYGLGMALLALATAVEAMFAYNKQIRGYYFNEKNLAFCEVSISIVANFFLPTLYADVRDLDFQWSLGKL